MKKIKQNKGFTLVEMLTCVITLFLLCMICTTGMDMAMRSYQNSVYESDSQMLEATINMYLTDILRYATDIKDGNEIIKEIETIDGNEVSYKTGTYITDFRFTNTAYGIYDGEIDIDPHKGEFIVFNYIDGHIDEKIPILSEDTYSGTLKVTGFWLEYVKETGQFNGYYTIESTVIEDVKKECTFTCRSIAE